MFWNKTDAFPITAILDRLFSSVLQWLSLPIVSMVIKMIDHVLDAGLR